MGRRAAGVLCVVAMAAVVVGVDVLFFRGHVWERLVANLGIVLVFVAFYFRFLRHAQANGRGYHDLRATRASTRGGRGGRS
jgi:membrane protein implicated in regulation of membrane protease activity